MMKVKLHDTSSLMSTILGRKVDFFYEDLFRGPTELKAYGLFDGEIEKILAIRKLVEQRINDGKDRIIRTDDDIFNLFKNSAYSAVECVYGLYLNNQKRVIHQEVLAKGTAFSAAIRPREIIGPAVALSAAYIVLVHNHPSGSSQPSEDDLLFTHELLSALSFFDIDLLDHVIISASKTFWSMKGSGILKYA